MRRSPRFVLVLGLLTLLASGTGCGSDRAETAETPAAPAATAPSAATDPGTPLPAVADDDEVGTRPEVLLLVLDSFDDDLLDEVQETLERELGATVRRLDPQPLPKLAYYEPRKRWRADKLIEWQLQFVEDEPDHVRVLGLTSKDISTTKGKHKDWGIFGLGYQPGRSAIVSSKRLERGARDRDHVRFRVGAIALHEVGHTMGLPHCSERKCPMQDAEGSVKNTDTSTGHLGPVCTGRLVLDGWDLPERES